MARRYFKFPISRVELTARKAYCNTMAWLGYRDFVVAAQGAHFVAGMEDLIDRSIALFGIWEGEQLEDLARVCDTRKADYFFDIGANAGIYSVLFATKKLVPQVVAFEPDPGNYAHLLANLHVNNLTSKIRTLPLAVGSQAGEVELMEAGSHNRGEVLDRASGQAARGSAGRRSSPRPPGALRRRIRHRRQDAGHQDGRRGIRIPCARGHGAHVAG